ncbi:MAG: tetratricopeptide repeat protein [Planctomycetota bacterium]
MKKLTVSVGLVVAIAAAESACSAPPVFANSQSKAGSSPAAASGNRKSFPMMRWVLFGESSKPEQTPLGGPGAPGAAGYQPAMGVAASPMNTHPVLGPQGVGPANPTAAQRFQQTLASNPITNNRLTQAIAAPIQRGLGHGQAPQPTDSLALSKPAGEPGPELMASMAKVAEKSGDVDAARKMLQKALEESPESVAVLRQLGRLEDRANRLAEAEKLYLQAVAIDPTSAGAHNDLGLCYARQGKLTQSQKSLEQAIALNPSKALYRNNVAKVLVAIGDLDRAVAHQSAVYGQAPAEYNVGQLLVSVGKTDEGAMRIRRAASLDPGFTPAVEALAKIDATPATQVASRPAPPATPLPSLGKPAPPAPSTAGPGFPVR